VLAGRLRFSSLRLVCAMALLLATSAPAFAQDTGRVETAVPSSGPPSAVVGSAVQPSASPSAAAPRPAQHAPAKQAGTIPYTIREGDTLGAVAQLFGVPVEDLARINRMHPDEELYVGDELRIPNPFTAEVNGLKAQVESLSAAAQAAEHKADDLQKQLGSATARVQELTADNESLNWSVRILPWWRASAVGAIVAAVLMFGVMLVTAFEWWRMRRRYVALAEMGDSLTRLDQKYKILVAKAELRIQQLYGRRRGGVAEGQPRPKLPEEAEIERLNEELKQILEHQLERMGARPGSPRRNRWRELFGGVSGPAEARSLRR
jgi:LysM repeat protein